MHLGNVSAQVTAASSPLRQFYAERYPHTRKIVSAANRLHSTAMKVHPPEEIQMYAGTVGTAFDLSLRYYFDPSYRPTPLVHAGLPSQSQRTLFDGIMDVANETAAQQGIMSAEFIRAIWGLARAVECFRAGFENVSDLVELEQVGRFDQEHILKLADDIAIDQCQQLASVFLEQPPFTSAKALGPILSNAVIDADADLITGKGTLVDIKTSSGKKGSDGKRSFVVKNTDIFQLITYALLDSDDQYGITTLAIYAARYGHMTGWRVDTLLSAMRAHGTTVAQERAAFGQFIHSIENTP